jgi:DinB superfamily
VDHLEPHTHTVEGNAVMPTMEDYAKQPREQRLQRLARTADDLAAAVKGQSDAVLSRRPDARNWAAKEIVCHLRDTEEAFGTRFEQILAMDVDPTLGGPNADRLADERQYLRNDAGEALTAFRQRRSETLETFGKLTPLQWEKGGIHPVRGRITIDGFLSLMAWHDDNHLDQLMRALDGRA